LQKEKKKLKTVFQFQFPRTVRTSLRASFRPSPDINQKIDESKNRSWVCLSPTFDFCTTIQTEIKKSKNQRIPNWSWSCDNRQMSEGASAPQSPIFYNSLSFHCVCEQITLLLRLLSPLKPSQTPTHFAG
jgi:hypothetical protein